MAQTYEQDALDAYNDIKEAGQPVSFYIEGKIGYNDVGEEITIAGETAEGHGLLFSYSANLVNGTTIQAQDAYVLYAGDRPSNGMLLDHGGRTWSVITSEPLQPTSAVILYKVQVR